MTDPLRVRMSGPLIQFKAGFAAELQRQGYAPRTVLAQLRLMAHLSRWLADECLDPQRLSPVEVERFLATRRAAGYTSRLSREALVPLLSFLRGLGAVPPTPPAPAPVGPVEELLHRYRRYLTVERGLNALTADGYAERVRPFLEGRICAEGLDLARLSAAEITTFVAGHCPRQSPGTAKLTVTALRSLLVFLHLQGEIARPLATAVPSVAGWRLAGLPKRLEPAQLRALLGACDRSAASGRRDFAIISMLSRLGLRRGEVAALRLSDIDWRAGEFIVSGKGRREERLPLPADIGEAIAAYLRDGRPPSAEGRAVFVGLNAPHHSLSGAAVAGVVARAGARCGLGLISAHRLRHTAASETLRAGASLPEVGQLLRHSRIETTAIYAKVDREALRGLALPWPGGSR